MRLKVSRSEQGTLEKKLRTAHMRNTGSITITYFAIYCRLYFLLLTICSSDLLYVNL